MKHESRKWILRGSKRGTGKREQNTGGKMTIKYEKVSTNLITFHNNVKNSRNTFENIASKDLE